METSKNIDKFEKRLFLIFLGKEKLKDIEPTKAIHRLFKIVLFVILACMALSYPLGLHLGWGFQEMRPVTWVSFFQLLLVSFISKNIFILRKDESLDSKLWYFLYIFFIFLAFDELLRLHESIDHRICDIFGFDRHGPADHIDDLLILFYGVFGVFLLIKYFSELMVFKESVKIFIGAAIFATLMVVLDFLGGRNGVMDLFFSGEVLITILRVLDIIEESCKSFAEICFVGAFLKAYYSCLKNFGNDVS